MTQAQDIIEECRRMKVLAQKQRDNAHKMVEEAQIMIARCARWFHKGKK